MSQVLISLKCSNEIAQNLILTGLHVYKGNYIAIAFSSKDIKIVEKVHTVGQRFDEVLVPRPFGARATGMLIFLTKWTQK